MFCLCRKQPKLPAPKNSTLQKALEQLTTKQWEEKAKEKHCRDGRFRQGAPMKQMSELHSHLILWKIPTLLLPQVN